MNGLKSVSSDISLLHEEINALRSDLNRFRNEVTMNKTNSLLGEFKNQCAGDVITGSLTNNLNVIKNSSNECSMWEYCEPNFIAHFEGLANYAKEGQLSDGNILLLKNNFDKLKKIAAGSDQCANCLGRAETCFEEQIETLQKMNFYQPDNNDQMQVQDLPEKEISSLVGDALSCAARVQIMKALYDEGKSFTALSKLTKLRGGNLLFHLDKLQSKGLIHQREERGEYHISLKGHNLLNSLLDLVKALDIGNSMQN